MMEPDYAELVVSSTLFGVETCVSVDITIPMLEAMLDHAKKTERFVGSETE